MKDWDEIVERVAREIYEAKLKGPISEDMVKEIASELMKGVHLGFSEAESVAAIDEDLIKAIEKNVYIFSGFKNYQQLRECTNLLKDESGNIRSFDDFLNDVKAIDKTYNELYLKAEYETATTTAMHISRWQKFEREKKVVHNLIWLAIEDETTCEVCGALNGTIRPVNDSFWNTHGVPAHWRCKCTIAQAMDTEAVTPEDDVPNPTYPDNWKQFETNAGKTGVIFPEKHPYFEASKKASAEIKKAALALVPLSGAEAAAGYSRLYEYAGGGYLDVHDDADPQDLERNIADGKVFAKQGYEVQILPHSYEENIKNPETNINGDVGDFKHPQEDTHHSLQKQIAKAAQQGASFPAIFIDDRKYAIRDYKRALRAAFEPGWNKSVEFVYIVYPDHEIVKITRAEVEDWSFVKKLKTE